MNTEELYQAIIEHLGPYHPKRIGIFGSHARNTQTAESDLDILVSFEETVNLLDLIGLELGLSELLGVKVDLITEPSLYPLLKDSIEKDLKIIFDVNNHIK